MKEIELKEFLEEEKYIDYSSINITRMSEILFEDCENDKVECTRRAFRYVRDHIKHSFDINATIITSKASDVLRYGTGLCHAKANLLAAFLRRQGIPTGFCYQYLTLEEDASKGYFLHCYNAAYLEGKWVSLDARGNKENVETHFSLDEPEIAYVPRVEFGEYNFPGIYKSPHMGVMKLLEEAENLEEVIGNITKVTDLPDPEIQS